MKNNTFSFTKTKLLNIKSLDTGRSIYKDVKEEGLVLIVSYGGSKIFYLAKGVKGGYKRIRIGAFPSMDIPEARAKAAELKAQIAKGINPVEKHKVEEVAATNATTFQQLFNRYIADYAKHHTKTWKADVAEMDKKAACLYDKEIVNITRNDIQKIFNEMTINGKYSANRFLDRIKAVLNKAIEWELLDKNPASSIQKHREKTRDRYITSEEKARFFAAVEEETNQVMKDFILIALYTAARKSNVLSMRWDNINLEDQTWYIPDTKNGEPQLVPLTKKAMAILLKRREQSNSEWVFPSAGSSSGHLQEPKKAWKRICQKAELKDLRIHDLRRTAGSWMAISGASQYVIGKALNHKSPRSTAIYARLSLDPVRKFMEKADRVFDK